jgi:hypothetical protein
MATDTAHVKGLAAIDAYLQAFPVKYEKNVLRGGLRQGANVVKAAAQQNIHSISGKLAKGLKVGTRVRGDRVTANVKATGIHGFVGRLLEFTGAKPHQIAPKKVKALLIGGKFYSRVEHGGFRKKPWLRPALDQTVQAVLVAVGEYCAGRLVKDKGIDQAYVMVEGDE